MILRILAVIMMIAAASSANSQSRTWELPSGVKSTEVNGYDIAYVESGSGPLVVLVHGAMSDYRYFSLAGVMTQLAARNRVIVVSLRHYFPDRWEGKGSTFSMRQHVDDVAALIRKLGAGPAHVVGHSRGGSLALYLSVRHPDVVRTITVAEGGSGMAFEPASAETAARDQAAAQRSAEVLALLEQGKVEDSLVKYMENINGPGAWNATPEPIRDMLRSNVWTLKGETFDKRDPYGCDDARRINVPILLVGGEKSLPRFGTLLDGLQSCLARVERVAIANAGHSMPRQNPKGFSDAVIAFVAKH